jgi:hypothetical protein
MKKHDEENAEFWTKGLMDEDLLDYFLTEAFGRMLRCNPYPFEGATQEQRLYARLIWEMVQNEIEKVEKRKKPNAAKYK